MDSRLLGLIIVFAPLSLFSFGGGQAVVGDIQYQTVVVHGWLTNEQFTDLYAVSRAAPGPPVAVGLIFAGMLAVLRAAHIIEPGNINYLGLATVLTAGFVLYVTNITPYILIGIVAILYASLQFF
jgi:chromate transporter